jgi:hypothetical protein
MESTDNQPASNTEPDMDSVPKAQRVPSRERAAEGMRTMRRRLAP